MIDDREIYDDSVFPHVREEFIQTDSPPVV